MIIRHDAEFAVVQILSGPVPLRFYGLVIGGMIIEGQTLTVLSENCEEQTPEGTPACTLRPIGEVNLRVEGIWLLGKKLSWVQKGDSCIIKFTGEGGNLVKRGLVLSKPEVDPTTLK